MAGASQRAILKHWSISRTGYGATRECEITWDSAHSHIRYWIFIYIQGISPNPNLAMLARIWLSGEDIYMLKIWFLSVLRQKCLSSTTLAKDEMDLIPADYLSLALPR